jgi:roadblock/LC7 domain-containing protein
MDGIAGRKSLPPPPGVQQITFIMHTAKCAVSINGHMGVFVDDDITTIRKGLS